MSLRDNLCDKMVDHLTHVGIKIPFIPSTKKIISQVIKYDGGLDENLNKEDVAKLKLKITSLKNKLLKAETSLKNGGYEDLGAELWKPPVQKDSYAPKYFKLESQFNLLHEFVEKVANHDHNLVSMDCEMVTDAAKEVLENISQRHRGAENIDPDKEDESQEVMRHVGVISEEQFNEYQSHNLINGGKGPRLGPCLEKGCRNSRKLYDEFCKEHSDKYSDHFSDVSKKVSG